MREVSRISPAEQGRRAGQEAVQRRLVPADVRSFDGFDRPWRHLERLTEDVRVREMAFGGGYIMTGRTPA